MNTPPNDGKGFAGLSGWVVDNRPDLELAKSASRKAVPPPVPQDSSRASPTPQPASRVTPAAGSGAPTAPSKGVSLSTFVWLGLVGIVIVAFIRLAGNDSRSQYSANSDGGSSAAGFDAAAGTTGNEPPAFDPVTAYITATTANVRSGAGGSHPVVGTLPQMSEVQVIGREGSWSQIRTSLDGQMLEGYVSGELLTEGDAVAARSVICEVAQSSRPVNGEILVQTSYGRHQLTVDAGEQDAFVKLRREGVTALAFYVRAGESATVDSVPNGTYQILFASGDGFSRKCLEFVESMQVITDPAPLTFEVTTDEYFQYFSTATYKLTTQAYGNFRPATVDESAFRE